MKTIEVPYYIDNLDLKKDKAVIMTDLCKVLRDGGIPCYYSTKVNDIIVQSGKLAYTKTETGFNFIWESE